MTTVNNRPYVKIGNEIKDISDGLPFEIPDSWEWVRLSSILNICTGSKDANQGNVDGIYDFYTCALEPIKSNSYSFDGESLILPGNGANVGVVIYYKGKFEAYQRTYVLQPFSKLNLQYIQRHMEFNWKSYNSDKLFGSAIPYIKYGNLANYLIALPPLAEQERIVAEIEKYEPLLAEYDKLEQQATKLDTEIYDKLKKSILQYAIQGKLVPQDPADEPASVLLERIRAEKKAKLGKKYVESYIYKGDDNCYYEHIDDKEINITNKMPYDLPDSWCWSRISSISDSYIGLTYKPTDILTENGYIVLRSSNIKDGKLDLTDIVRVSSEIPEKLKVKKNDIIICARNGSKKLVGKSAIIDCDIPNLTFGAFMAICKTPLYEYVSKFLLSSYFYKQLAEVSGTTTINQLTQASFNSFLIPIPPLAEQQRIVDKINEIFAKL